MSGPKRQTQAASNKNTVESAFTNNKDTDTKFSKWSSKFPRTVQQQQRATNLTSPQLSALMQEALDLSKSNDDGLRRVALLLASKGGSIRLAEVLDQSIATLHEVMDTQLLPVLEIIRMLSAKNSPVLASCRSTLLETLYGLNGERAVRAIGAMNRYSTDNAQRRTVYVELAVMIFVDTLESNRATALTDDLSKVAKNLLELTVGFQLSETAAQCAEKLRTIPLAHNRSVNHSTTIHDEKRWSMYPDHHNEVMRLLQPNDIVFHFHPVDDDIGMVGHHATNAAGYFICDNEDCSSKSWASRKITMFIRLYAGNLYNARTLHITRKEAKDRISPTCVKGVETGIAAGYRDNSSILLRISKRIGSPRFASKTYDRENCFGRNEERWPFIPGKSSNLAKKPALQSASKAVMGKPRGAYRLWFSSERSYRVWRFVIPAQFVRLRHRCVIPE
ncbi:hypothetical protein MRB53_038324 [Persea americana]|nr:hypothetical protein MRB53_038324 [Persea americana]